MKVFQFPNDPYKGFYKELSSKVNAYIAQNPIPEYYKWLKFIFYSVGFLCCYSCVLIFGGESFFQLSVFYFLSGIFVLGLVFNVSHDCAHQSFSKSQGINKVLYYLTFVLLGNNPFIWKKYHIKSHHVFTNVEGGDIDVIKNRFIRLHPNEPHQWYHRYQIFYIPFLYIFYSLNFIIFRDVLKIFGKSDRTVEIKFDKAEVMKYIFYKSVYFLIFIFIPYWFLETDPVNVILGFLLMTFLNSLIIVIVLSCNHQVDLTEHVQCKDMNLPFSWVQLQMKANLDYNPESRMLNFLVGGFNAHTVHHLFPAVHHGYYPKIVPIIRETAAKYGIKYNETDFYTALKSHFRFIKKLSYA